MFLQAVSFPECITIGSNAFGGCSLSMVSFPKCETIGAQAFYYCKSLSTASFPSCTTIGSSAFGGCSSLGSIYLLRNSIVSLMNSNAFYNTPMYTSAYFGAWGSIYVRSSLAATYKTATNWSYFSARIVGV